MCKILIGIAEDHAAIRKMMISEVKEIANIWYCTEKNVEYYRDKIYKKLDITSRQELIAYAKKIGYEF